MPVKKITDLIQRRIFNTLKYSLEGFMFAWRSEEAIRIECCLMPLVIIGAIYLGQSKIDQILMISSGLLIIMIELLNTAIEKTIDRISTDQHPLSKVVKDVGSGAVLLAMINFVWLVLLF
jgi:diacylglycerol kinase (ATP)